MRHVISLSTIPPRFGAIGPTLQSLLAQQSRPEAVQLYIPQAYRRFPQWGGALPSVPEGVTIVRAEADLGPATKILPAARAWHGQEVELLYGDDDQFYPPDWAASFLKLCLAHPGAAVCGAATSLDRIAPGLPSFAPGPRAVLAERPQRQPLWRLRKGLATARAGLGLGAADPDLQPGYPKLRKSGHVDIAEGFMGVAVRPEFFDDEAFAIPPVVWTVDDVWLSGHLARRGVPIWADRALNLARAFNQVERTFPLYAARIDGVDRPAANVTALYHMRATYGIWGGVAAQST